MAKYLIGRGKLKAALRDPLTGFPLAFRELGECPSVEVVPEVTYADNFETQTCAGQQDLHVAVRKGLKVNLTMKEITNKNLALLLAGNAVAIAAGAATNLAWPTGIVAGEEWRLPDLSVNVSALTITDSAGVPVALASGTNYTADLKRGTVKFTNVTGFTQPFKASFTRALGESVAVFQGDGAEYHIILEIENVAENCRKYSFEAFRAVFDQPQAIALKGEEVAQFQSVVTVLRDDTKPDNGTPLGQYARWIDLG